MSAFGNFTAFQNAAQPAAPVPLAISDFENGVYSIGGVSKTLSQMWEQDLVNWGDVFLEADVVANSGLTYSFAASGYKGPVATASLNAALSLTAGLTCIIEYTLTQTGTAQSNFNVYLMFYPGYNPEVFLAGGITYSWIQIDGDADLDGPGSAADVRHRMAATMQPGPIGISIDGGTLVTKTSANNFSQPTNLALEFARGGGTGTVTVTMHKITFYAPRPVAVLETLSA